ncbi:response regulator transcription factor [Culicoidibacter larvae]|uniref:Response regulator transcription factor n=1 Tax=Culicoidibacter larvae TaxID=2579976 RepID=A0A5R8QAN9_9FIRM|nr:response regulator transcription factor [Culicoidibacter larvae]TLG71816.1 response regulator transcription factor [Culicoidibacter larvae]
MKRILFVDDDDFYRDVFADLLLNEGYAVDAVKSAAEGIVLFKKSPYDLVLSDLKMDTIDGSQLLTIIRKYDQRTRIVILTGSDDEQDELRCLDLFANEYLKKSTPINILLKRIEIAMSSDTIVPVKNLYSRAENIEIENKNKRITKNGESIVLTQKEFDLLTFFLSNKNRLLTREEILQSVWRADVGFFDTRTVDTYVKKLRAKLQISSIASIRGAGYEWLE